MKHFILLFFALLSLGACSQNKADEIAYLKKFYAEYVNNWDNETKINLLKKDNFSKALFASVREANSNGQIDYDPIINAQDIGDNILKSLNIKYQKNNDLYEVSYLDNYKKAKLFTYIKLISNKTSFIISDIKVNDIESLVRLNANVAVKKTNVSENKSKITIRGSDIVINFNGKEDIYKNLIVNEMSISTNLNVQTNYEFTLIYELNASATKIKEQYKFQYLNNKLYLIFKEVVKFSSKGTATNRIYFSNHLMKNRTYEDLQSLGNDPDFQFNNTSSVVYLYGLKNVLFGKISNKLSTEDYFIKYPEVSIGSISLNNVEEANNIAYYLEQLAVYKESIYLLNGILKKEPQRVVAWLNLADAQWDYKSKADAKVSYQKYIALMKSQGKDLKKIPQRVYDRIK